MIIGVYVQSSQLEVSVARRGALRIKTGACLAGALCYSPPIAKLWPEWVVLSVAIVTIIATAVYAFEVGAVLVKETAVNLLLVFQFDIRFFVIDDHSAFNY